MPPERGLKLRISDIQSDLPPLVPLLQKLLESKD
jgi:hypothetical protein